MSAATRNFNESLLISKDAFGSSRVYCGEIDGGATKVAITRPKLSSDSISFIFGCAIEKRLKLRHSHIAPLIGYCDEYFNESFGRMFVYHFRTMANGSLHEHLYRSQGPRLTWTQRLDICIGAARGLHYLHGCVDQHAIIHGNLKSGNVLLDDNWVAKITGDFSSEEATDRWLSCYSSFCREPEFRIRDFQTKESDVYGFGAFLFEVLCAKADRAQHMVESALRHKEEGKLDQYLDPALEGDINMQSLNKFAEIAAKCVADEAVDRPSMEDVVSDLECALQLQISGDSWNWKLS